MYKTLHKKQGSVTVQLRFARSSVTFCAPRDNSQEWKDIRRKIIIRDNGCDLGLDGYEIRGKILIHHMNPIRQQDILLRTDLVLNPEYLIATTLSTHNAIHYGDEKLLLTVPNERRKNDTCPWRH